MDVHLHFNFGTQDGENVVDKTLRLGTSILDGFKRVVEDVVKEVTKDA